MHFGNYCYCCYNSHVADDGMRMVYLAMMVEPVDDGHYAVVNRRTQSEEEVKDDAFVSKYGTIFENCTRQKY